MRPQTSSSTAASPSVPRLFPRTRSSQNLLRCAHFLPLLLFLSTTTFIRNLPFHLSPPSLPAQYARFPSSASSSSSAALRHTTLHSSPSLSPADRLAFCEDALLFRPSSRPPTASAPDLALLSCDPSRREWNTVMGPLADPYAGGGGLWVVDPLEGKVRRVEMEWEEVREGTGEFHPLGIEVERTEEGEDRLFVVNHRANRSTIEIFTLSRSPANSDPLAFTATHLATLSHPSFTGAPNSLAAYSSNSFFLSHDHRFNRRSSLVFARLANAVETIFALPLSGVDFVRFDLPRHGQEAKVEVERVISGVAFANGLALSPAKDTLVVASTTRRQLLFYRIDPASPSAAPRLELIRTVSLPFLVDNLSVLSSSSQTSGVHSPEDETFVVVAAGHPSYLALLSAAHRLSFDSGPPSPLASLAAAVGLKRLAEWRLKYDWREQDGGSWVVAVPHPLSSLSSRGQEEEWETVFQSRGRPEEGGFGGSTTAVSGEGEGRGRWIVVTGLYAEGVRLVRERERGE
ncbi:hypothetical protein NBRC10512_001575 [Rhodotorula toruloides]|uniref:RHTO0S12e03884g1_1 n=2 Tax=Rhodotorula toruloides TaxID=5286 RepID=A0A061B8Y5_RHOTO|nr:serum paraoxonase/arylesterase [Rhodotorula toruloides NP11]EMS23167.1 serum paraoxonase/arylesterase [Rhodotorula toruloides NP11]CDR46380.1 RHTO0S12e03884g1_1 [Rhodotorula toruloides]